MEGLSEHVVRNPEGVMALLREGAHFRTKATTRMNKVHLLINPWLSLRCVSIYYSCSGVIDCISIPFSAVMCMYDNGMSQCMVTNSVQGVFSVTTTETWNFILTFTDQLIFRCRRAVGAMQCSLRSWNMQSMTALAGV